MAAGMTKCGYCGADFWHAWGGNPKKPLYCSNLCTGRAASFRRTGVRVDENKKARPTGSCPTCGSDVPDNRRRFCSRACSQVSYVAARRRREMESATPKPVVICVACGSPYTQKQRDSVACSRFCYSRYRQFRDTGRWPSLARARRNADGSCAQCGGPIFRHGNAAYCSESCSYEAQKNRARENRAASTRARGLNIIGEIAVCARVGCGAAFNARQAYMRFCSRACAVWNTRGYPQGSARPIYIKPCPDCSCLVVNKKSDLNIRCIKCHIAHTKWRTKLGGTKRNALTVFELVERDGTDCFLCGDFVDVRLSGLMKMGPTVDHVIPKSLHGPIEPWNERLAHRICNSKKGNRFFVDSA